jgi:hypothetical protein
MMKNVEGFFRTKKQAKMQWLQHLTQRNLDNLNNVRLEVNIHFRNLKKVCLTAKIYELGTKSKNKNVREFCRDINDFKKGYVTSL